MAGYHHTYFRADDLDLLNLLKYPDDTVISKASDAVYKEAQLLLETIGIDAATMLAGYVEPSPSLDDVSAYEMALAAESNDKSLIIQNLSDATDDEIEIIQEYFKETLHPQLIDTISKVQD
ncbi:hypothetical protein PM082_010131 [Marasmius tenuissimus]|nr:hypothetical protein PM082_010131 [Marasmius tenuissimus]